MLTCCPLLITEAQFRTDSKSHSVIVCTFHFQETMTIAHISVTTVIGMFVVYHCVWLIVMSLMDLFIWEQF